MKILMYSTGELFKNGQTGGIKRFIELARYLQKEFGADLCCADDDVVLKKNGLRSTYQMRPIKAEMYRFFPPEGRIAITNRDIIKRIKNEKYDYIISFDVPPTVLLCLLNIPNIVLMIRKDLIGYFDVTHRKKNIKTFVKRKFFKLSEGICLKKSKKIVTQCLYDERCLLERHPLLAKTITNKFVVQINNINPSWISNKIEREEKKDNQFKIGFIGNFNDSRKGHEILLKSAQILIEKYDNVIFYIVGAGTFFNYYKEKYECEKIVFMGHLNAPWDKLNGIDLNVVPSLADSCPNTIMEALYFSIPVIGSNVGGIPEILCDEHAIFEPNCSSLVKKISELIENQYLYNLIAKNQYKRSMELSFNWSQEIFDKISCD